MFNPSNEPAARCRYALRPPRGLSTVPEPDVDARTADMALAQPLPIGQSARVHSSRGLVVAIAAVVLVSCQQPCSQVDCVRPSVIVDLRRLPSSWLKGATVTGCVDKACHIFPLDGNGSLRFVAIPLVSTGRSAAEAKDVQLHVDAGIRRVFSASAAGPLRVWNQQSRCPNRHNGNVWAVAERDGSIQARSPF